MPTRHFFKAILSNAFVVQGAAVPFTHLPGNNGVIALETGRDDAMIAALDKAASDQVGGIMKLSPEEYEDKKKEANWIPSEPKARPEIRVVPSTPFPQTRSAMAALAAKAADPGTGQFPPVPSPTAAPAPAPDNIPTGAQPVTPDAGVPSGPSAPAVEEGFRPAATRKIKRNAANKPADPTAPVAA